MRTGPIHPLASKSIEALEEGGEERLTYVLELRPEILLWEQNSAS